MALPDQQNELRRQKLGEAIAILKALGYAGRQANDAAGYTLLACLNLLPHQTWRHADSPLRGITPIIQFISTNYAIQYAPNTRETIRDDAVKHFVETGLLIRNPDDPARPTNSGRTAYQIEPEALSLIRHYQSRGWASRLSSYQSRRMAIRDELSRKRTLARVPVRLPGGEQLSLSPGGQNPLIKAIIEEFCPRWVPGGCILYIGDTEKKFLHTQTDDLSRLGVRIDAPEKIPDVVIHDSRRNWLVLIEAVTTAGPVDGKRRKELKELFGASTAGLVFVTAFLTREALRGFVSQISWETEVWVAESPDHLIHFNGERFLGPYPDVTPKEDD